jgi:hypothetical protein
VERVLRVLPTIVGVGGERRPPDEDPWVTGFRRILLRLTTTVVLVSGAHGLDLPLLLEAAAAAAAAASSRQLPSSRHVALPHKEEHERGRLAGHARGGEEEGEEEETPAEVRNGVGLHLAPA